MSKKLTSNRTRQAAKTNFGTLEIINRDVQSIQLLPIKNKKSLLATQLFKDSNTRNDSNNNSISDLPILAKLPVK
jgi:hypothetical protein